MALYALFLIGSGLIALLRGGVGGDIIELEVQLVLEVSKEAVHD